MVVWSHGLAILEAILFASPDPLPARRIAEVMGIDEAQAHLLAADLRRQYEEAGRGVTVRAVAGGYQIVTRPDLAGYVERLVAPRPRALSQAALETLAIVAYRQPVTRAEIEAIRGVSVDRVLEALLERRLIKEVGRREGPGRPILYGTTEEFLIQFGLRDLSDLPPVEPEAGGDHPLIRHPPPEEKGSE